ncbi:MAG: ABC transporter substrate-binding protein [Alicyclobacillus sp.]|nr:ABC transporter substrate-binding protein [Alicyclobacillus sp.]
MKKAWLGLSSAVVCAGIVVSGFTSATANTRLSKSSNAAVSAPVPSGPPILLLSGGPGDMFEAAWFNYGDLPKTLIFRRLLMLDVHGQPTETDLAKSYKISSDGLTYTFTLRDNIKWQDGVKFTPEDVKWSLEMALKSTSINPVFSDAFSKIVGADAYVAGKSNDLQGVIIHGNTITIKLTQPVGDFLLVMAQWPPYPKHLLQNVDPAKLQFAPFWKKPIGDGPYMVTKVVPNNYAILKVFKGFYGPKPKIPEIELQTMTDDQVVPKALANQLDYAAVMSLDEVKEILKDPAYKAYPVPILYDRFLMANITGPDGKGNKKIRDLRVREALLYAINRKAIADKLFPGQASVLNTLIPTDLPEYDKNAVQYNYDPAKAKKLLQEAHFDFSQPIMLQYYYTDPQTLNVIQAIKYYWEQIGVKVNTALMTGDLPQLIYQKRNYDFLYAGLSAMSFEEIYSLFDTDSPLGMEVFGGSKDKWDPLIENLRTASNPKQRTAAVHKLQEMESQFLWRLPLFSLKQYIVVNTSRLKTAGVYGNEWTNYDREFQKWELKVK